MKRKDLITSREFWIAEIQLQLFDLIEHYRNEHQLTKTQVAEKLGVTKGYVTQVLNGDFDHKVSKLVDLALAFDKVPVIHFIDIDQYVKDDAENKQYICRKDFKPVKYYTVHVADSKPAQKKQLADKKTTTGKTKKTVVRDTKQKKVLTAKNRFHRL